MKKEAKRYRPNVAAIVLSSDYPEKCDLFVGERSDIKGAWQFPQGGVDDDEALKEALLRELEEEIGTRDVEVVAEHPEWICYDFPGNIADKMYPFDGQRQKYFLVRLKDGASINLDTPVPEFARYRFVPAGEVLRHVSYFKRPIYKKVIGYFRKSGYL
jgi:putative (di)nucleoside polyphosphate hydrolase